MGSRPQHVRSDDWGLDIPTMLAQTTHQPKFPLINENIFLGQNMRAPIRAPILSPLLIFQPNLWGFLIGKDFGVSWLWQSVVFGIFFACFFLLLEITRRDVFLSVCGSLLVVFSPFFQLWSFHKGEVFIGAIFSVVFFLKALRATSTKGKVAWSLGFGWALGEFAFSHIYPPIQVSMAWAAAVLTLGLLLLECEPSKKLRNSLWVSLGLILFASSALLFLYELGPTLKTLNETVYPGKRFSVGGSVNPWTFFSNHFFARHWVKEWGPLANISEAGHGFLLLPAFVVYYLVRFLRFRKVEVLPFLLIAYGLFLFIYSSTGIPAWLSQLTFFYRMTSNRSGMALLLIDIVLLMYTLKRREDEKVQEPLWLSLLPSVTFALFLFACIPSLLTEPLKLPLGLAILSPLLFAGLFWLITSSRFSKRALVGFVVFSFFYSMSYNPIVRGGSRFIYENPLSQKILQINQEDPAARWMTFGISSAGDLLRILGIPTFGGFQAIPSFETWKFLDPQGVNREHYNRMANVYFDPTEKVEISYHSELSVLQVSVNPNHPSLKGLNVKYFLVSKESAHKLEAFRMAKKLFEYGNFAVFSI